MLRLFNYTGIVLSSALMGSLAWIYGSDQKPINNKQAASIETRVASAESNIVLPQRIATKYGFVSEDGPFRYNLVDGKINADSAYEALFQLTRMRGDLGGEVLRGKSARPKSHYVLRHRSPDNDVETLLYANESKDKDARPIKSMVIARYTHSTSELYLEGIEESSGQFNEQSVRLHVPNSENAKVPKESFIKRIDEYVLYAFAAPLSKERMNIGDDQRRIASKDIASLFAQVLDAQRRYPSYSNR